MSSSTTSTHTKESQYKSMSRKRPREDFISSYTLNKNDSTEVLDEPENTSIDQLSNNISSGSSNSNFNNSNDIPNRNDNSSITLYPNISNPNPGTSTFCQPAPYSIDLEFSGVEQSPPVVSFCNLIQTIILRKKTIHFHFRTERIINFWKEAGEVCRGCEFKPH
jgi:hypothetical protein